MKRQWYHTETNWKNQNNERFLNRHPTFLQTPWMHDRETFWGQQTQTLNKASNLERLNKCYSFKDKYASICVEFTNIKTCLLLVERKGFINPPPPLSHLSVSVSLFRYIFVLFNKCSFSCECLSWPSRGRPSTSSSQSWAKPWAPSVTSPSSFASSSSSLPSWGCNCLAKATQVHGVKVLWFFSILLPLPHWAALGGSEDCHPIDVTQHWDFLDLLQKYVC